MTDQLGLDMGVMFGFTNSKLYEDFLHDTSPK